MKRPSVIGTVLSLSPDHADARFGRCMAQLPIIYQNVGEIAERRAAYEERLRGVMPGVRAARGSSSLAKGWAQNQPFFLAYQGQNDRDLQALYGSAVCKIMSERYPAPAMAPPARIGEPVRWGSSASISATIRCGS